VTNRLGVRRGDEFIEGSVHFPDVEVVGIVGADGEIVVVVPEPRRARDHRVRHHRRHHNLDLQRIDKNKNNLKKKKYHLKEVVI